MTSPLAGWTPPALVALLAAGTLACGSSGARHGEDARSVAVTPALPLTERFDDGMPAGWRTGTSNAAPETRDAVWSARADDAAPSPPGTLSLVDAKGHAGQQFNLCWDPALSVADVDLTVAVRAHDGVEDQGGGPAWRIGSSNDYYAARWNPLEDNFRVYSVVGGQRLQLDSARVRVDPAAWHSIRVRHVGASITCWFDGEELLHAEDAKLPGSGSVGLWAKADATTSFDDLIVDEAR